MRQIDKEFTSVINRRLNAIGDSPRENELNTRISIKGVTGGFIPEQKEYEEGKALLKEHSVRERNP